MLHLRDLQRKPVASSKYGNKQAVADGYKFDSQAEANRYLELKLLEKAGEITELKRQVIFELLPGVKFSDSARKQPALRYIADFTYFERDKLVVEDIKSKATETALFKVKRHLMLAILGHHIKVLY